MAIGVPHWHWRLSYVCLASLALAGRAWADDQLTMKNGSVIVGQIDGVSEGEVMLTSKASNGSLVKLPYQLTDIQSVSMAAPAGAGRRSRASRRPRSRPRFLRPW